jgi:hypothetical protein
MGVEAVQSTPPSDHHPTGSSPAVMETASLSLAGCDCRPMGTSPIETKSAPRLLLAGFPNVLANGPGLIAEMREHPGRSAQHHAMFASVQTGRLAPNRYY